MIEMNMDKQLILYQYGSPDGSDRSVAERFNTLIDFAGMLGQDTPMKLYHDSEKPQDQLQDAIDRCREEGGYLLCYDLESLCPDRQQALDIIDTLTDELLFVMFVDDESTMQSIMNN